MDINFSTDFVMSHIFKYFTKFSLRHICWRLSNRYVVDRVLCSRYRCYWCGMNQCPIYCMPWWYHDRTPWLEYMMLNIPTVFLNTFFSSIVILNVIAELGANITCVCHRNTKRFYATSRKEWTWMKVIECMFSFCLCSRHVFSTDRVRPIHPAIVIALCFWCSMEFKRFVGYIIETIFFTDSIDHCSYHSNLPRKRHWNNQHSDWFLLCFVQMVMTSVSAIQQISRGLLFLRVMNCKNGPSDFMMDMDSATLWCCYELLNILKSLTSWYSLMH